MIKRHFVSVLPEAVTNYRNVIAVTHAPPSARLRGRAARSTQVRRFSES